MADKGVTAFATAPASLRSRLQTGIAWNLVGTVFNQGGTLIVNIIVANILGRDIFGEYAIIQNTLLTMSAIAQLATGYTATKYVAEFRSIDREKTGRILGLCSAVSTAMACIAALVLLVGARWLAAYALKASHLAPGLMIAAGAVLFAVMNGYQMGTLAGLESYPALAKAGIISGILYVGICVAATWAGGLQGTLAGLAASALVRWAVFNWFLRRESARQGIALCYRGIWQERPIFFNFALPSALSGFTTMPALWLANAFLVRQPGGYAQMALYSAANNLRVLVLFLPNIVNNVGMSLINYQKGIGDDYHYRKVFWANMAMTVVAILVGVAMTVLLGPWLLRLFGKDFTEGYPVLMMLMLSTLPEGLVLASYQVIQSQGKMWLSLLAIALPRDGMIVLLAYILTGLHGAIGLALAYAIAWGLAFCIVSTIVYCIGLRTIPEHAPNYEVKDRKVK